MPKRQELKSIAEWLTIKDVCQLMGLSYHRFNRYKPEDFPPPIMIGNSKLWRAEVIIPYIKKMGL